MSDLKPREEQQEILAYRGGRMGVSAVPGAGKTFVLSMLAAQLVRDAIDDEQEVLIVTLVNSAVENIRQRIGDLIGRAGLLANVGYRVRTLHGLAHDIVRERPGSVRLAEDFQIVDERVANQIREGVVDVWLRAHPGAADDLLALDLGEGQRQWITGTRWPETVRSLASAFIKRAKDSHCTPGGLQDRLAQRADGAELSLARMAIEIYADYQKALHYRGGVDFDDLIYLARMLLDQDEALLARLHYQWPYVLEDEAQDSSEQQERILDKLTGPNGNWVRVGDPNQAINTTFTTADPKYLKDYLARLGEKGSRPLKHSGRSQQHIIDLANHLVRWTMEQHPSDRAREALVGPPFISLTPAGDPQPNPDPDPTAIHLIPTRYSPEKELADVVRSAAQWCNTHPEETVAVLVPRNDRGFDVADALRQAGVTCIELLRSSGSTRKTAGALGNVLRYLGTPLSAPFLARVFEVWRRNDRQEKATAERLRRLSALIRHCRQVETFLWPRLGYDWLDSIDWGKESGLEDNGASQESQSARRGTIERRMLEQFRELVCRWQEATILPVDQLLLMVAQDLFIEPGDLALAHKLAVMLRSVSDHNPSWRLAELTAELAAIAQNQRRFLGFVDEDGGLAAEPGKVTVSTLHKSKGLEWDRVYLMSINNYSFPSAQSYDEYISEKWFIRDHLNLEAEALAQLNALSSGESYAMGSATYRARIEYVRERLRLLYVGITRARKELVMTWNTGRSRDAKQMAVPFIALRSWWEEQSSAL